MGEEKKLYRVSVEKPEGKRPLGGIDGKMESEWILGRLAWGGGGLEWLSWLRVGTGGRLL
jgi:hypothetical protein